MKQQDVISFFDRMAPTWDADMIRHDDIIARILDPTLHTVLEREGI